MYLTTSHMISQRSDKRGRHVEGIIPRDAFVSVQREGALESRFLFSLFPHHEATLAAFDLFEKGKVA